MPRCTDLHSTRKPDHAGAASLSLAAAALAAAPCAHHHHRRSDREGDRDSAKNTMRAPRPPSPAPAPAPSVASRSGAISSPPSPYGYAVGAPGPGPGPVPESSAAAVVRAFAGGSRGGGSLSPPLIAMLAVVGAALMVVLYARLVSRVFRVARRRWRRRRLRLLMIPGSPSAGGDDSFASFTTYDNYYHTFSPYYGLDETAIKSLPSAQFLSAAAAARGSVDARECAVCLLEFADGDELRALPLCAHAFHADCIDVWLRAHASCPLCRAAVALPPPVASPLRAARRVRPSLDDLLLFHPFPPDAGAAAAAMPEIAPASPDQLGPRDFLLKRSYSFGFERNLAVEAASTASPPWRYRVSAAADGATSRGRSFWSKRWPSPFGGGGGGGGSAAARVFSFRSYRSAAAKSSPFSRRRGAAPGGGSGFFMSLASEPPSILAAARRSRAAAASSRLRCGDPEALLSPDRLSR
ncbi:RING-H2 finger protein ATL65-like [Phragmites australis]|uniref:RING-H2 finger protein ATL65-like n=1 Tax=Phragmites australis TaxID=29695 RepID=UPI002D7664F3|nr:RING-H2 finger protein ATL65-like [Phragmites australis]